MIYRLPFYTACTDFLINCNFFINMLHTAIYAQVWDDMPCRIIGALNWAFLTINICFYAVIAIITYLRICRDMYLNYGKYDYKLWLIIIAGSIIIQLVNIQNNGKRDYWCAAKSGQFNSAIILFTTITIVLSIILFCYISILRKVHKAPEFLSSSSSSSRNENTANVRVIALEHYSEVERKAAKKILSYIAMFILQWIPMLISQGARFVLNEEPWVYVMGTIGRSFGGIGNLLQFILNEGFFPKSYDINYDNENSGISLENMKPKINSRDDKIIIINEN
ncbi:hypothetical protein C1646_818609 [Rhizophagus diaphanus]|nr:hypothetical protein C1646_818609 [Rhizophagus diaphanus] [Rhizophagus sp. MUCL 43196]